MSTADDTLYPHVENDVMMPGKTHHAAVSSLCNSPCKIGYIPVLSYRYVSVKTSLELDYCFKSAARPYPSRPIPAPAAGRGRGYSVWI
jgi:hypothetical protein